MAKHHVSTLWHEHGARIGARVRGCNFSATIHPVLAPHNTALALLPLPGALVGCALAPHIWVGRARQAGNGTTWTYNFARLLLLLLAAAAGRARGGSLTSVSAKLTPEPAVLTTTSWCRPESPTTRHKAVSALPRGSAGCGLGTTGPSRLQTLHASSAEAHSGEPRQQWNRPATHRAAGAGLSEVCRRYAWLGACACYGGRA